MNFKVNPENGKIILRIALSLVFLWFGASQLYHPSSWTGFVPVFVSLIITPGTAVMLNGFTEILLGLMLIFGLYTRFASLLLGIHLIEIAFSAGGTALAVRDLGLAFATLVIFFNGEDKWCMDKKFKKELHTQHTQQ